AETATAGFARAARLAGMLQRAVAEAAPDVDPVIRASAASALAGAMVSAWHGWAAAGVRRGPIAPYLSRALAVVRGGLDSAFG
ncbi:MAG: hypothetical protein M3116_05750, partial [Actinomycetota bacterium]|nr:hypothetical protein [Actinomycetota bacterium]